MKALVPVLTMPLLMLLSTVMFLGGCSPDGCDRSSLPGFYGLEVWSDPTTLEPGGTTEIEVGLWHCTPSRCGGWNDICFEFCPTRCFRGSTRLSVEGLPPGVTAAFEPEVYGKQEGPFPILRLTASHDAHPGSYPLTVHGTGGNASHSDTFTLEVTPREASSHAQGKDDRYDTQ